MSQIEPLLLSLWKDLHDVSVLWQLLVVALSMAIAWWISRLKLPSTPGGALPSLVRSGRGIPLILTALALVVLGRLVLVQLHLNVALLNVVVPLLIALTILRALLHMLRPALAPSAAMGAAARAISWLVWLAFAVYITGFAPDLMNYLDTTGFRLGAHRISLLLIMQAVLSVLAALLVSLWLGRVLEDRVMSTQGFNISLKIMLTNLLRPLLVAVALLMVLPTLGIDLTALSVFGGAIGVGIGLGLQKIASNYISGFVILLDRSVTIGDFITIDKHSGKLTKMTARYVVLRNANGAEIIVPNETVITSTVINHSYSDKTVRVPIEVQIGYDSDVDTATRALLETARNHPRALQQPEPRVMVTGFAESGISLELGVWVNDPEEGRANLRSDIYRSVLLAFKGAGIKIPYPQRELRLHREQGN